jgi:hypothetical protein
MGILASAWAIAIRHIGQTGFAMGPAMTNRRRRFLASQIDGAEGSVSADVCHPSHGTRTCATTGEPAHDATCRRQIISIAKTSGIERVVAFDQDGVVRQSWCREQTFAT